MRFRSLAARVSLLVAAAVGLSVALVATAAFLTVQHQLHASLDNSLLTRATSAARTIPPSELAGADVPSWVLGAADVRFALLRSDGSLASRPDHDQVGTIELRDEELAVARGQADSSLRTVETAGGPFRVCAVPGPTSGTALVLAQSLEPTREALSKLGFVLALFGVVGVVLAGLAGGAVARNGLRPVRVLTDAAEDVARTERLDPISVQGTDELARLATAFNSMLLSLAASRDRQRQLVADAGHELRTPLTSLRTNLDLLAQADAQGGLSAEQRAELMADVRFQIDELTTLIGDLTELARDEPIAALLEPVDLAEVVDHAVERVRRRAHGLQLEVALEPTWVTGEPASLERAVTNLLDNAVKWSPPLGTVTVTLSAGTLYVADQGPGIDPKDLPHVFERFYRSTESRTLPGSGLGLSIVRRIAERHNGTVRAGNAPLGGAAFWFRIPTGPAPHPDAGPARPAPPQTRDEPSQQEPSNIQEPTQPPLSARSASADTLEP